MDKLAKSNSRIMITGKPGTGKSLVARQIHEKSSRGQALPIIFNCAGFSQQDMENKLFGKEQDSQHSRYIGAIEQAHHTSLILENCEFLSQSAQSKLLRFLEYGKFKRQGGNHEIEVDCRLLTISSANIEAAIGEKQFHADLYHRLSVHRLDMPDFKMRRQDCVAICEWVLKKHCLLRGLRPLRFSGQVHSLILSHDWQENGIEMRRIVENLLDNISFNQQVIEANDWQKAAKRETMDAPQALDEVSWLHEVWQLNLKEAREQFERYYLQQNLAMHDHSISKTAQAIGMERTALHRKLKSLNINME